MTLGLFLGVIAGVVTGATVILLWAVVPLLLEARRTVQALHHLLDRSEPDLSGLLHDANRIMDDAAVLSESLVKQKQTVDAALEKVGYALGRAYGRARNWMAGTWVSVRAGCRKSLEVLRDGNRRQISHER